MASWKQADGFIFISHLKGERLTTTITLIECLFDEHTDYEIKNIEIKIKNDKIIARGLRRLCWLKLMSSPIELPFSLLFLGKHIFKEKLHMTRLMLNFIIGRTTHEELLRANEHSSRRMISNGAIKI